MAWYTTTLTALLALLLFGAGTHTVSGEPALAASLARLGVQRPARILLGVLELLVALTLFVGLWAPAVALTATIGLTLLMTGAVVLHVRGGDPPAAWGLPAWLGTFAVVVCPLLIREI